MLTGRPITAAPTASTDAAVSLSSVPENRTSDKGFSWSSISISPHLQCSLEATRGAGPQVPGAGCHAALPKKELRRADPAGACRPIQLSRSELLRDLQRFGLAARDEELEDQCAEHAQRRDHETDGGVYGVSAERRPAP